MLLYVYWASIYKESKVARSQKLRGVKNSEASKIIRSQKLQGVNIIYRIGASKASKLNSGSDVTTQSAKLYLVKNSIATVVYTQAAPKARV